METLSYIHTHQIEAYTRGSLFWHEIMRLLKSYYLFNNRKN